MWRICSISMNFACVLKLWFLPEKLWLAGIASGCIYGIFLNKNINYDKNKMESKMENLTHSFREKNLMLQLIPES